MNPTSVLAGPPSSRRNVRGSAWNARCANESPSTASNGLIAARLEVVDRRREPVGRDLRRIVDWHGPEVVERDGSPNATLSGPRRANSDVPVIPAGTSGTPASSAMRAAPVRHRASWRLP